MNQYLEFGSQDKNYICLKPEKIIAFTVKNKTAFVFMEGCEKPFEIANVSEVDLTRLKRGVIGIPWNNETSITTHYRGGPLTCNGCGTSPCTCR